MSIITISRGSYSRGVEIAEKIAKRLGYECISREVLLEASKEFNIPEEKVNIMGGSTAIGHPLGATMIRLPGTLARILKDKKAKYGIANACCGGGQGVATVIENLDA